MKNGGRNIFLIVTLCLAIAPLASCGVRDIKGIPVHEYKLPEPDVEQLVKRENEAREEIAKLAQVKENSVFTEKEGVPEYKVGPGDVLTLTYWMPYSSYMPALGQQIQGSAEGFMQTTFNVVVRADGKISYSFGDDIPVSGHTVNEVREILLNGARNYIKNPRLEVVVKEYKSKAALLMGQINNLQNPTGMSGPGKYILKDKTSILDLIISAGGPITGRRPPSGLVQAGVSTTFQGNGDLRKVELVRKGKRYTLNLYSALFGGDMRNNIIVDDGDMITVPEEPVFARRVYVFGQVFSPGIFSVIDANDVLSAIAAAGYYTPVAVRTDIKIIRGYTERQGKPLILSVNLDEILKRGDLSQNIPLQDGDLVYVPRKTIGDINEFISNINPLMLFLTTNSIPANVRSAWIQDQNWLKY